MKGVVGISCFSSGKWLEMRVFDGLSGLFRLVRQTVECHWYGLKHAYIYALAATRGHRNESKTEL